MKKIFPILPALSAILLIYASYQALKVAPTDALQGDVYRIIYYHVPSAWTAFLLFLINFVASITYLVWRNDKSDVLALVSAEVGVVFCTIVLVTGPIWARPVWGIWWAPGDIRLTSTLVLWLIYVSYLVLRKFSTSAQTQVMAAALAVFGALDVPLVYFSIWFFRTQHPQPVIGGGGSMDPRMLHTLLVSWLAFLLFAFLVCWSRYRLELLKRGVERAEAMESLVGAGAAATTSLPLGRSPR
ncbi:MAG TPA: cytochrome c biogenesis protein [Candidatus Sulfotelmatobacter sp.]|nr:cytochrome c biogenesis protein [Candidatus Sulfotelmatobacter sp.]